MSPTYCFSNGLSIQLIGGSNCIFAVFHFIWQFTIASDSELHSCIYCITDWNDLPTQKQRADCSERGIWEDIRVCVAMPKEQGPLAKRDCGQYEKTLHR